jgi:hypothetical protein
MRKILYIYYASQLGMLTLALLVLLLADVSVSVSSSVHERKTNLMCRTAFFMHEAIDQNANTNACACNLNLNM